MWRSEMTCTSSKAGNWLMVTTLFRLETPAPFYYYDMIMAVLEVLRRARPAGSDL